MIFCHNKLVALCILACSALGPYSKEANDKRCEVSKEFATCCNPETTIESILDELIQLNLASPKAQEQCQKFCDILTEIKTKYVVSSYSGVQRPCTFETLSQEVLHSITAGKSSKVYCEYFLETDLSNTIQLVININALVLYFKGQQAIGRYFKYIKHQGIEKTSYIPGPYWIIYNKNLEKWSNGIVEICCALTADTPTADTPTSDTSTAEPSATPA